MPDKLDLLVVAVPVLDLQYPPSSPAIIKACAQAAGFSARTLDLNLLLRNLCGTQDKFYSIQYNFENVSPVVVDTKNTVDAFFDNDKNTIQQWLDDSVDLIRQHNPRWLGISVFSYKSHKATLALCVEVQQQLPDIQIVLGGRGASSWAMGPDHSQFRQKMISFFGPYPYKNFGETLLHYGVVDKVIQGDGEQAVIDLLAGTVESNIQASVDKINLETVPYVDFDDYDLTQYEYVNEPTIPITGSKGCVRKCTFCDIPVLWPKFKFRSGQHIAGEMIHLYERHGVKKFYMSDSLVNGSMTAFTDFITTLAEYNQAHPEAAIKWVGQYITRPISSTLNDRYYNLLKASGGEGLTIGVESGSDAVRAHMKKQFRTVDIDAELAQFSRSGIVCVLLFFSCYPTETWQDFLDTVNMFIRYQQYCASGTVYKLTLGTPYTHHQQTPLWNMQDEIGLKTKSGSDILWLLNNNPELTFYERVRRRLILQEVATALRLPMSRNTAELNQMINSIELHQTDIDEFFGTRERANIYPDTYNLTGYDNLLMTPDIQQRIKAQVDQHPEYVEQILKQHVNIADDIRFDNDAYSKLKEMIL
jgi:radical SAM superfamily enzyme YgiQ (UPF0313 family)